MARCGQRSFSVEATNLIFTLVRHLHTNTVALMTMMWIVFTLFILSPTDSVRLVDGSTHCAGRVEVLHRGQWGTVCDDDWDMRDAAVVCRELGCGEAVDGQVWTKELQCRGNESQIHLCPKSYTLKHDCSHDNDVGLVCAGKKYSVRLVDGGGHCSGRVEVLHRGQWGTLCDDDWDMRDAAVVCRELGCGEAVDVLGNSHFGPGSGPIWMDDVDCSGSESTLKTCTSAGWGKHDCNQTKNFTTQHLLISLPLLVGGPRCSGRVEVLHGKTWATVCDADFDQQDAEVVCRELGCGAPVEVLGAAAFGRGEGQVWTKELQCRGNESQIHLCPKSSTLKHDCSHDNDVGLVCADMVRLVDGSSRCAGRVEVLHRGQWGTVCDDDWDMRDAAVVCRELGCGEAVDAVGNAHFGPGSGPIWMNKVVCSGSESTLKNCGSSGRVIKHDCSHDSDVALVCADSVRLVDGGTRCAGRVEVLHRGQWGTVCVEGASVIAAVVVCRQLGCGGILSATVSDTAGSGPIWMSQLTCSGSESTLKNCGSLGWGKHRCSHLDDAELICSGTFQ
uniref:SRCR domain-containing protein n=1 Tax=Electrophorus electricus TaxID=8005 RepID=A0A4W4F0W5_ELEEL